MHYEALLMAAEGLLIVGLLMPAFPIAGAVYAVLPYPALP